MSGLFRTLKRRGLIRLLEQSTGGESLSDQAEWFRQIYLKLKPLSEASLEFFLECLGESSQRQENVSRRVGSIARELDCLGFFCDSGLTTSSGFLKEFFHRLGLRFLPEHKDFTQLSQWAEFVFKGDVRSLRVLEVLNFSRLAPKISFEAQDRQLILRRYHLSLILARKVLASRIASFSTHPDFRSRVPLRDRFLLVDIQEDVSGEIIERSRRVIGDVQGSLESGGVSIELVFLLEKMKAHLKRLEEIYALEGAPESWPLLARVFAGVLEERRRAQSVSEFLNANLSLISKKIVERAGVTGEHYIAHTPRESWILFWSSAGGGALTTLTTFLKSTVSKAGLPLFGEGFLAWLNYSVSFMFLQFFHLTLATKTPSMTASVLAHKFAKVKNYEGPNEVIEEMVALVRSGFLAITGNVVFVALGAVALDLFFQLKMGRHVLGEEAALHYIESHHWLKSLTLWYAIYTGGALWFGSVLGGWFENWFVFRKLPEAVEEGHLLVGRLPGHFRVKVAYWLRQNIMGIGINVALGFLLAFSTIIGKFFGVPLDVRHVTLSSGTLAFSYMGMEHFGPHTELILGSLMGILCIGILNFYVSFFISFLVAAKAKELRRGDYSSIFIQLVRRFFRSPFDFFFRVPPSAQDLGERH